MLVDIHCHLDLYKETPVEQIISGAEKAGVGLIISNGTSLNSDKKVLEFAKNYKIVKPALGLYPTEGLELSESQRKKLYDFIRLHKSEIVAIGEVGIDFFHVKDEKDREKECKVFSEIIQLANEIKKPLIVHSRKATSKALELLSKANVPVVMHCFAGTVEETDEAIKRGYYFTVPPTLEKNKGFKKTAKRAPIDKLLTETDGPYLSPTGGESKPENVRITIDAIARLKNLKPEEVEDKIYKTCKLLFNL